MKANNGIPVHSLPLIAALAKAKAKPKSLADLVKERMASGQHVKATSPLAMLVQQAIVTRRVNRELSLALKLKRVPFGATTWSAVDAAADADRVQELTADLRVMLDNVVTDPTVTGKAAAITALLSEYQRRLEEVNSGTS